MKILKKIIALPFILIWTIILFYIQIGFLVFGLTGVIVFYTFYLWDNDYCKMKDTMNDVISFTFMPFDYIKSLWLEDLWK